MKKLPKKSTIINKCWELCKQIVRKTYANKDGSWTCYTCGRRIENPQDAHTAHFIPSSICGAFLRHNPRNLRVCCYNCNVNLGGNGTAFYPRMVKEIGQEEVDQLFRDKQKYTKDDVHFYISAHEYLSALLKSL